MSDGVSPRPPRRWEITGYQWGFVVAFSLLWAAQVGSYWGLFSGVGFYAAALAGRRFR